MASNETDRTHRDEPAKREARRGDGGRVGEVVITIPVNPRPIDGQPPREERRGASLIDVLELDRPGGLLGSQRPLAKWISDRRAL